MKKHEGTEELHEKETDRIQEKKAGPRSEGGGLRGAVGYTRKFQEIGAFLFASAGNPHLYSSLSHGKCILHEIQLISYDSDFSFLFNSHWQFQFRDSIHSASQANAGNFRICKKRGTGRERRKGKAWRKVEGQEEKRRKGKG